MALLHGLPAVQSSCAGGLQQLLDEANERIAELEVQTTGLQAQNQQMQGHHDEMVANHNLELNTATAIYELPKDRTTIGGTSTTTGPNNITVSKNGVMRCLVPTKT